MSYAIGEKWINDTLEEIKYELRNRKARGVYTKTAYEAKRPKRRAKTVHSQV